MVQKQAVEIAKMKATIEAPNADLKADLVQDDTQVKEAVADATRTLWEFLEANNHGIMKPFHEADAAVGELAKLVEEVKVEDSHKPSSVATGPRGLAFMGLRADLKNLTGKVDTQFMQFMRNIDEVTANVNVAATAAGAAEPAVGGTGSNAMA